MHQKTYNLDIVCKIYEELNFSFEYILKFSLHTLCSKSLIYIQNYMFVLFGWL